MRNSLTFAVCALAGALSGSTARADAVVVSALTVSFSVGGTATNGVDFVQLSGTVTFPAKKTTAKATVQLVDDPFHEGAETIDVAVVPGADYTESLASSARITIVGDD